MCISVVQIIVVIALDTTIRRISPHFTKTEWNIHSSSNTNWHKLPSLLLDKLYQKDGESQAWIDMISEAKAYRLIVALYRSPTIVSDFVLHCKFVRVVIGHFLTRASVDDNDCMVK